MAELSIILLTLMEVGATIKHDRTTPAPPKAFKTQDDGVPANYMFAVPSWVRPPSRLQVSITCTASDCTTISNRREVPEASTCWPSWCRAYPLVRGVRVSDRGTITRMTSTKILNVKEMLHELPNLLLAQTGQTNSGAASRSSVEIPCFSSAFFPPPLVLEYPFGS
jgi:hypothetical protein